MSKQDNTSLFALTMVNVLALPINRVTGQMGMNIGGIPPADHVEGFWVMLLLIAALTAMIGWFALRKTTRRAP
jgi:zinc transporter